MAGINEKESLKALKYTQKKFNSLMLANEKQMKQLQIQLKNMDSRQKEIITTLNKVNKSLQNTNLSKDLQLALKNINLSDEVGKKIQNLNMSVEFAKALEKINLSDELGRVIQNIDVSNDIRDAIKKFESFISQDREIIEKESIDEDEDEDENEDEGEDYNNLTNQRVNTIREEDGLAVEQILEGEDKGIDEDKSTDYEFNDYEEYGESGKSHE